MRYSGPRLERASELGCYVQRPPFRAMAELIQKKTSSTTKPKTTCFLRCFGISRKLSSSRPATSRSKSSFYDHLHLHQHHKINKPNDIKMKTTSTSSPLWYLISCSSSRFCASSKSATKTVPIHASGTGTGKRQRHSKAVKSSLEKTKSKSISESGKFVSDAERTVSVTEAEPPGGPNQREDVLLSPVSDLQQTQKPPPQTTNNTIILENKRRQLESSKDDTCQKRLSFYRKIDSLRSAGGGGEGSQPGSPVKQEEKKPKSSSRPTASSAVMSHSESFPIPSQKRQNGRAANPALPHNKHSSSWSTVKTKADDAHQHQHQEMILMVSNNKKKKKNLDPLVGMSIIVVTLIIMLFWGRLCAILCTSAWFYFNPRFTSSAAATATATSTPIISGLDLNSGEYKKKVVLEGFLDRSNHRNNNNI